MKISKLNWRKPVTIVALGAGIIFYSCNNKSESGNNSTTETDTTNKNMTTVPATNTDTGMGLRTDTATGARSTTPNTAKKRTGKITVAAIPENKQDKMQADASGYYNYAEVMPVYSGGQKAITDYITNNIEYPQSAIDNNVGGTVNVQFGIDENGKISNEKAIGTRIGNGLEEEAVRVISAMPKWTAGTVKGKKVKTWMIMPITFRIEE
jgi:TonB family protein